MSRREMLSRCATGFGGLVFSALAAVDSCEAGDYGPRRRAWQPKKTHYQASAKNVIFLYMDGGPSQVDTFDYKPALAKYDGREPGAVIGAIEPTQFNNNGKILKSPWKFAQHGQSGAWVSGLFPNVARHVDKLCFIKSTTSKFSEHTFGNFYLHTGSGMQGRPSMGAWIGYGLGSECQNLPGYVVLNGGLIPPGGLDNFGNGFLPAAYQGSVFGRGNPPLPNVESNASNTETQRATLDLLAALDQQTLEVTGSANAIESAIQNYEIAFQMQVAVPDLVDISDETQATLSMYGLDANFQNTQVFGRQCLLARRLIERGVRFVELTCPAGNGDRWDQHSDLKGGHERNARSVDQPIAALLTDLDQRGLLNETLVLWAGEFGRTPFAQGANGRDHNPYGFTVWLAGGGIARGMTFGATDEWGYRAVADTVEIHDLHATILHLLGLDHTRTTFRYSSRDMRLTDVHGRVLHDIIAA